MDIKTLTEVAKWIKGTDLSEVEWREGCDGFEVKSQGGDSQRASIPSCTLLPESSPAVGIYRAASPGRSAELVEGMQIKAGQELGYVEMARERKPVTAAQNGYLRVICVEDGKPVQYGQPLFFIEPK